MADKDKPGGGVRYRAHVRTATGRRRSVSSLTQRLIGAEPGSGAARAITAEINRRFAEERRRNARAEQATAAARNIPGGEFMSPAQLRAAVRRGGAPTTRGTSRAPQTARERAASGRVRGERRQEFMRRVFG
jgi:hypothetical protein